MIYIRVGELISEVFLIFDVSNMALSTYKGEKEAKIGPIWVPKQKSAHYEAKWDFKVPEIHSWIVILVCYLNKSARSIYLITVGL